MISFLSFDSLSSKNIIFRVSDSNRFGGSCVVHGSTEGGVLGAPEEEALSPVPEPPPGFSHSSCPPEVHKTCFCVRFIAEHTRMLEDSTKVLTQYILNSY